MAPADPRSGMEPRSPPPRIPTWVVLAAIPALFLGMFLIRACAGVIPWTSLAGYLPALPRWERETPPVDGAVYQFNPYAFRSRVVITERGGRRVEDRVMPWDEGALAAVASEMPGFLRAPEDAWVFVGASHGTTTADGHREIPALMSLPRALASATDEAGRQRCRQSLRDWYHLLDERQPLDPDRVMEGIRRFVASYPEFRREGL
ncbi:MAG: hypothetical protein GX442_26000 [Candidatus Riflebacteria bacterium]|nr:hypothetical protein [Candidatus Riflebacteria bacterium]